MKPALLLLVLTPGVLTSGDWHDSDQTGEGSYIYRLAHFSLRHLKQHCTASNSIGCSRFGSDVNLLQVLSAKTQVVSGKNYILEVDTTAGHLHLKVYEQAWTKTLKINEATLVLPPEGMSMAMLTSNLIEEELALDAEAFEAEPVCPGGKVWMDCGSPCQRTCEEPDPICIAMCKVGCSCPSEKPIWQASQCIAASSCTAVKSAGVTPSSPRLGGWTPATDDEVNPSSRIHRLVAFSLKKLKTSCSSSNSITCGNIMRATLHHVQSAFTQIVNGVNFAIEAKTSAGILALKISEHPNSQSPVLVVQQADFTLEQGGTPVSILDDLGQSDLVLDHAEFDAFLVPVHTTKSALFLGGGVQSSTPRASPQPQESHFFKIMAAVFVAILVLAAWGQYARKAKEQEAQPFRSGPDSSSVPDSRPDKGSNA
ncbi:hypothetical protein AB1Y20_000456 [Prymnesium parvum]|uniref:TIL domain-containing protein n=1 Tax=Prymnesium parvum TaxID=97485 RepID=A0AB34KA51_PRYPA